MTVEMTVEECIRSIREDQEHGAAYLAREALRTLLASVETGSVETPEQLKEQFLITALQLLGIRPGMPAIGHLVARAAEILRDCYAADIPLERLQTRVTEGLEGLVAASRKAHEDTVHYAVDFLKDQSKVLTFSWSSNVQDTLIQAASKLNHVYMGEARPLCEGQRLARLLAAHGISTTLITDAAMGSVLGQVDLCLVGADGVLQDGSLINKTGSLLLALAADRNRTPFYAICETFKYHVGAVPYETEEMPPKEICEPIPGVKISNRYFETIPYELVRGYITELGVVTPHLASKQIHRWQRRLSEKRLFGQWK